MKITPASRKPVWHLALPLLAAVIFAGCATPLERRIEKYPQAWGTLPTDEKVLAEKGAIVEGMTKDGVFFSWGPPHRLAEGGGDGAILETWRYYSYVTVPTYRSRFGFGYGYGGYRSYYPGMGYGYYDFGPDYVQVPEESASVEFQNGKVRRWETAR
jgi:outer membrane protein assembly factor BamE (lipoprotein component of BamABCDE complex)